jgi:hypothetical protein
MSDPLSLHKYLYTHGNPVMGIDPSGMISLTELGTVKSLKKKRRKGVKKKRRRKGVRPHLTGLCWLVSLFSCPVRSVSRLAVTATTS